MPRYIFSVSNDKSFKAARVLVGIGILSDTHCIAYDLPFSSHPSDLPTLLHFYEHFKTDFEEFAKESGKKVLTILLGLGDLVAAESPLGYRASRAQRLLRLLRKGGLHASVVGNHELLFGVGWLAHVLVNGCGANPRYSTYGAHNLTLPQPCCPPDLPFSSRWLTTEEAVSDLCGRTDMPFDGFTVSAASPDRAIKHNPDARGRYDVVFAHSGFVNDRTCRDAGDPDEVRRTIRRLFGQLKGIRMIADAHSHIRIPPEKYDGDPSFTGSAAHFVQVQDGATSIGFLTFGVNKDRAISVDAVFRTGRRVPYFLEFTRPRQIRPASLQAHRWSRMERIEQAVRGKMVGLDWTGWGTQAAGVPESHIVWYGAKALYLYARKLAVQPQPDLVVLNHKSLRDHCRKAVTGNVASPFYGGKTPAQMPLAALVDCYRPAAVGHVSLQIPPGATDKQVRQGVDQLLAGLGDGYECYPDVGDLCPSNEGSLVVWVPGFLGNRIQTLASHLDGVVLTIAVAGMHRQMEAK